MTKTCQRCGVQYEVPRCQALRSKFCSDRCSRASRNTKVLYGCDHCGQLFWVRKSKVDNRRDGKTKHLCCSAGCAKDIQKPKWDDIQKLFQDRGYDLKSTQYVGNKDKLEYVCRNHPDKGSQYITYNNIRNGYGCRYCGREATARSRRLTFDEAKAVFARNDMELLGGQTYINTATPMAYLCIHHRDCGVQYMTTSNAYRNHCPYCHRSKGENRIEAYLSENEIEFVPQYKVDGLVGLLGRRLSYDFYLPNHNILIEYQGEFHDGSTRGLQTAEMLQTQQEHDARKREYAKQNNIKLLEIWYYDFSNIEAILESAVSTT